MLHAIEKKKKLFVKEVSSRGDLCRILNLSKMVEPLVLLTLLLVLVFVLYWPAIHGPFVFDDTNNIEQNTSIHISELSVSSLKRVTAQPRPVAMLSFALNYYLHGLSPMWFRTTNICIHVCTAMLLYFVLRNTILFIPRYQRKIFHWLPAFTALLWVIHPLEIQSVVYIVQRMNSLAGLFYLLTLLLYIRSRLTSQRWIKVSLFVCGLCTGLLAVGSKPNAATLPAAVFMYEWFFLQDLSWKWFLKSIPLLLGTLIVVSSVAYFFLNGHPFLTLHHWNTLHSFTCLQRLMTEFRIVIFYLSLFLLPLPSRLNIDHDILLSTSLLSPLSTIYSLAGIIILLLAACMTAGRYRLFAFGIFWYFLNMLIESTIIPLDFIFEHRTYIPNMMLTAGVSCLIFRLLTWKAIRIITALVVLFTSSLWTYQRIGVWKSGLSLWQDTVNKTPGQPRPHESLAYYLEQAGQYRKALYHYKKALQLNPNDANTHNNIGNLYAKTGKYKQALQHYNLAVKLQPQYWLAKINKKRVLAWQGNNDQVIAHYKNLLSKNPDNADIHRRLAELYVFRKEYNKAMQQYDKALEIEPQNVEILYNKGVLLIKKTRFAEAEQILERVIFLRQNLAVAYNNIGIARENLDKKQAALQSYKQALLIDPNLQDAQTNFNRLFRKLVRDK